MAALHNECVCASSGYTADGITYYICYKKMAASRCVSTDAVMTEWLVTHTTGKWPIPLWMCSCLFRSLCWLNASLHTTGISTGHIICELMFILNILKRKINVTNIIIHFKGK
jgi:hypothetical protein